MTSARITGTNEGIATYGTLAAGRDFDTLATWEALIDVGLTTGIEQVTVSNINAARFITGELLDFSSSGATATFYGINGTTMYYLVLTGTPTTSDTVTSNGASAASADIDSITSTSTGMTAVLEFYDDLASFADAVTIAGATTSGSSGVGIFFRILRAAPGEGHDGTTQNGVTFKRSGAGVGFKLEENFVSLQDIIITRSDYSSGGSHEYVDTANATDQRIIAVLAFEGTNTGVGNVQGFRAKSNGVIMVLCLAHAIQQYGFEADLGTGETARFYNCVATDQAALGGFTTGAEAGTAIVKNCLADGNTGAEFEGTWNTGADQSEFNTSGDDTTSPGGNSRDNQGANFAFVDAANDDFHITTSDTGARDFGKDLSADGAFAFDEDIDGTVFVTWDMGFNEPGAAATGHPPLIRIPNRASIRASFY